MGRFGHGVPNLLHCVCEQTEGTSFDPQMGTAHGACTVQGLRLAQVPWGDGQQAGRSLETTALALLAFQSCGQVFEEFLS